MLHCTIYIYAVGSPENTLDDLAEMVGGGVRLSSIETDDGTLSMGLTTNDEYCEDLAAEGAGDFLFFPYLLDVEQTDPNSGRAEFLSAVSDLLERMFLKGFDYATSADFESELPRAGRSRAGPWPSVPRGAVPPPRRRSRMFGRRR